MARDPEMVRRAQDVWYPWACGDGSGRLCSEMMADFAADEVERQAKWLRGQLSEAEAQRDGARASRDTWRAEAETARAERDAAVDRAESAEARVRELEAKHPAPPHTPRVGDVVGYKGVDDGPLPRVVVGVDPLCWRYVREGEDHSKQHPFTATNNEVWITLRPATPAERAAAGLPTKSPEPAEAPAAPRVLPEHLEWIEACAEHFADGYNHPVNGLMPRMIAARALVAAVARRDRGTK